MTRQTHDVIIIGAGLNGLACAAALAGPQVRTPANVCLIDAADPAALANLEADGRASAITATSKRMFEALGVWPQLAEHAQPMQKIAVTDSKLGDAARPVLLQFAGQHIEGAISAYMIENRHLYAALYDQIRQSSGIAVKTNTTITQFDYGTAWAAVTTDTGETLEATLLVAADGRNSPARQAAGIKTTGWAYGQTAIVLTVEHEDAHNGLAEEHFLPAGPFAILPLPGNRSSLVWTERSGEADRIMALDGKGFQKELELRFGGHLGQVTPVGPRHAYPLGLQISHDFVGDRLALIGDAAHVVHPIAGLGFNLGLRDIAALAEVIADRFRLGLDVGDGATLQQYQQWRRSDTIMVAVATDFLNRLFANDLEPVRLLRDAGLKAVDKLDAVKSSFMREAAGLGSGLPKLLNGLPV